MISLQGRVEGPHCDRGRQGFQERDGHVVHESDGRPQEEDREQAQEREEGGRRRKEDEVGVNRS